VLVDRGLSFPVGVVSSGSLELSISIFLQEVAEHASRVIGSAESSPFFRASNKVPRLPQGKKDVPESSSRSESLGKVFLTKGLIDFGPYAGVNLV